MYLLLNEVIVSCSCAENLGGKSVGFIRKKSFSLDVT